MPEGPQQNIGLENLRLSQNMQAPAMGGGGGSVVGGGMRPVGGLLFDITNLTPFPELSAAALIKADAKIPAVLNRRPGKPAFGGLFQLVALKEGPMGALKQGAVIADTGTLNNGAAMPQPFAPANVSGPDAPLPTPRGGGSSGGRSA